MKNNIEVKKATKNGGRVVFSSNSEIVHFREMMLMNNDIKSVAHLNSDKNDTAFLYSIYDECISMDEYITEHHSIAVVSDLLGYICGINAVLTSYQLSLDTVCFDKNNIFYNKATNEPNFVSVPCEDDGMALQSIKELIVNIILNDFANDVKQQCVQDFIKKSINCASLDELFNESLPLKNVVSSEKEKDFKTAHIPSFLKSKPVKANSEKPKKIKQEKKSFGEVAKELFKKSLQPIGKKEKKKHKKISKNATYLLVIQPVIALLVYAASTFNIYKGAEAISAIIATVISVASVELIALGCYFGNKHSNVK